LGILSQNEKRDKKHRNADWEFCLKIKNETKSTATLIGDFVSKSKTRQKVPRRQLFSKRKVSCDRQLSE